MYDSGMAYAAALDGDEQLGFDLRSIPIIGNLIGKGKAAVDAAVQKVTERVADFKTLPRQFRNLSARISNLQNHANVRSDQSLYAQVVKLGNDLNNLQSHYNITNGTLDSVLAEVESIKSGNVDLTTIAAFGTVYKGMQTAFDGTNKIASAVSSIESRVLSPAEQRAAVGMTQGGVSASTIGMLALLGVGAYFLVKRRR